MNKDESFDNFNIDLEEWLRDFEEIQHFEETFKIYEKECLSILRKSGWNNQEFQKVATVLSGVLFNTFGLWEKFPYSANAIIGDKKENCALSLLAIIREIRNESGKSDSRKAMRLFQLGRQFKVAEIKLNMDDVRKKFNDAKNKIIGCKKKGTEGPVKKMVRMIGEKHEKPSLKSIIETMEKLAKYAEAEQKKCKFPLIIQEVDYGNKEVAYKNIKSKKEDTFTFKTIENYISNIFPSKTS